MATPLDMIPASPAGMLAAVACVIAGGPWFSDGVRAFRARRTLAALRGMPGEALHEGLVTVRGRVALDSPLFAPLSSRPCAGYVLDVRAPDGPVAGRVREVRAFRLETPAGTAEVGGAEAQWHLGISVERTFGSAAELSANVSALLERTAELRWLKARQGPLVIVERALLAGREACVLGFAERLAVEDVEPVVLARTGTDAADVIRDEARAVAPAWRIGAQGPLELCVVSDRAPEPARLSPPAWRVLGAVLGPAIALLGLLVLARATGPIVGGGF